MLQMGKFIPICNYEPAASSNWLVSEPRKQELGSICPSASLRQVIISLSPNMELVLLPSNSSTVNEIRCLDMAIASRQRSDPA
jgi:hypothetical protein